jgi:hypothetical protein
MTLVMLLPLSCLYLGKLSGSEKLSLARIIAI